ncbi:MAG: hypothetical protein ABWY71_03090 [Candidatus Saccharimonadales bacterium]
MRAIAHPDLEISGTTLSDSVLGTQYFLTPDAAWLFLQLRQEPRIELLVPLVAGEQQVAQAEAKKAVYTLLGLLDNFGGVRVYWEGSFGGLARLKTRSSWRRRYSGTTLGFARSMLRAYGSITLAATTALVICRLVAGPAYSFVWLATPALLLATCVVHEAGHALAAQMNRIPFVFLARPGFAAIMYHRPGRQRARIIALLGPLIAIVFCMAMAVIFTPAAMKCLCIAAGVIHACSLLPFLADGRTLWRNI